MPILVFLCLSVLELGLMYATYRQTDVRQKLHSAFCRAHSQAQHASPGTYCSRVQLLRSVLNYYAVFLPSRKPHYGMLTSVSLSLSGPYEPLFQSPVRAQASGLQVERADPLRFLAERRKRRLNQALSVLLSQTRFLLSVFCSVHQSHFLCCIILYLFVFCLLVDLIRLSVHAYNVLMGTLNPTHSLTHSPQIPERKTSQNIQIRKIYSPLHVKLQQHFRTASLTIKVRWLYYDVQTSKKVATQPNHTYSLSEQNV